MAKRNGGIIGKVNTPTSSTAVGVWRLQDQFNAKKNSIWPSTPYSINFLVVAGGGGGGYGFYSGAGGGAGGYRTSTQSVTPGIAITVTVGDGAPGVTSGARSNGSDSSISGTGLSTITSAGGGFAGGNGNNIVTAGSGGSGGGTGTGLSSIGGNGGSGVVIIKYPDDYTITVGVGLTSSETSSGGFKIRTFTAGTGTVSFAV